MGGTQVGGTPDGRDVTAIPTALGEASPAALEFESVRHIFSQHRGGEAVEAVEQVSLSVAPGEIVALVGPSGCGKSTLLNFASGFLIPTQGDVRCFGAHVSGLNKSVAYQTQVDTLLPWRSVQDNAALPLEIQHVPKGERRKRAAEVLRRVGIDGFEHRFPHELSGGMRSRLSLARIL